MTEEKPSLHVDTDWKKQAQEEKKRLAEQERQRQGAGPAGPAGVVSSPAAAPTAERSAAPTTGRPTLQASFEALVQSIVTQVLFYLGELAPRGNQPVVDLDMAKYHIDTLGVLEEKTRGNLTPEEQHTVDAALYETRMRYISLASRYAELP